MDREKEPRKDIMEKIENLEERIEELEEWKEIVKSSKHGNSKVSLFKSLENDNLSSLGEQIYIAMKKSPSNSIDRGKFEDILSRYNAEVSKPTAIKYMQKMARHEKVRYISGDGMGTTGYKKSRIVLDEKK